MRLLITFSIVLCFGVVQYSTAANEELIEIFPDDDCVCPGSILTYRCTAVGLGSTQWTGTALNCSNALIFRHNRFSAETISGQCNNGAIVGRSLEVVIDNCYTSQLTVNISISLDNKTIQCIHNSEAGRDVIGISHLRVLKAPYQAPSDLHLVNVVKGKLTFSWTPPTSFCSSVYYGIQSDCGNCSHSTTSLTTAVCSDLYLSSDTVDSVCTFSVYSVFCNDIIENPITSDSVMITLRVPRAPEVVVTPVYLRETNEITKLKVVINQLVSQEFLIAANVSGTVTEYSVYLNPSSEALDTIATSSCRNDACEKFVSILSCASSVNINITVIAANILGDGPSSRPAIIGCMNQFVQVDYDASAATLSCTFQKQQNSVNLCRIQYGPCGQNLTMTDEGSTAFDVVSLNISVLSSGSETCYIVMATNGSYTVLVEGIIRDITDSDGHNNNIAAAVVIPIVVILIVVASLIIVGIGIFISFKVKKKQLYAVELRQYTEDTEVIRGPEAPITSQLQLKKVDLQERIFEMCEVDEDCSLKPYLERIRGEYVRGCAFYELLVKENVSGDKELIFMHKKTGMYYYPDVDQSILTKHHLIGEGSLPPSFITEEYRVFVQSTGPGSRHLSKGSAVLCERRMQLPKHPLIRVDTQHIGKKLVAEDTPLKEFCLEMNVFFEPDLEGAIDSTRILDVILMDKGSNKLFTGLAAKKMVNEHYCCSQQIDPKHWRVFISGDFANEELKKDTMVLYPITEVNVHSEDLGSHPSLICIDSEPFTMLEIQSSCNLESFRKMQHLEPGVFVEVPSGYKEKKTSSILDVILVDEGTRKYYTGYSLVEHVKLTSDNAKQTTDEDAKVEKEAQHTKAEIKKKQKRNSDDIPVEHKGLTQTGGPDEPRDPKNPTDQKRWRIFLLKQGMKKLENTHVLCRVNKGPQQADRLLKIHSKHFKKVEVEVGAKFKDLQKEHEDDSLFIELGAIKDQKVPVRNVMDVILMNKGDSTLFSGPFARHLVCSNSNYLKAVDDNNWIVYVHCISLRDMVFKTSGSVLCQSTEYNGGKFYILAVNEDNVRMSHFIAKFFKKPFENGSVFCELTDEGDDLLSYKEVVHVPLDLLDVPEDNAKPTEMTVHKLPSTIRMFYEIAGTPGVDIKPSNSDPAKNFKVFVQSTSQGSRCLKKGMKLLYKIKDCAIPEDNQAYETEV